MAHSVLRELLRLLPDASQELVACAKAIDAEDTGLCETCSLPLPPPTPTRKQRRFCDRKCWLKKKARQLSA
jgi:hypothetical protein